MFNGVIYLIQKRINFVFHEHQLPLRSGKIFALMAKNLKY